MMSPSEPLPLGYPRIRDQGEGFEPSHITCAKDDKLHNKLSTLACAPETLWGEDALDDEARRQLDYRRLIGLFARLFDRPLVFLNSRLQLLLAIHRNGA